PRRAGSHRAGGTRREGRGNPQASHGERNGRRTPCAGAATGIGGPGADLLRGERKLNGYQKKAATFAVYPMGESQMAPLPPGLYPALGLNGEAGEVAEKIKKYWRDGGNRAEATLAIKKELGDVLWYVSEVARCWGIDLQDVAESNIRKLSDRQE